MQPPHIVVVDCHNLLAYVCTTCAMPYNTTARAWWGAFCVRHLKGHCDDIRTVFWMASPSRRTAGTRYLPARRAAMGSHRVAYLAPRQCTDRRFVRAGQLPILVRRRRRRLQMGATLSMAPNVIHKLQRLQALGMLATHSLSRAAPRYRLDTHCT